jgi:Na+-transporting NADH:ubiquinone oxidoreductase subunit C
MAAVSIVFGIGVALVQYITQETLARNVQLHRNRVICQAFALADETQSAETCTGAIEDQLQIDTVRTAGGPMEVFVRQSTGEVGFVFSGMGFWDRIRGVLVLSSDLQTVRNIRFLEQKETPGLGARILEPGFTDQFSGLNVAWREPKDERIIVSQSPDDAANKVDAITGATQTSMAVMKILNDELARFRDAYRDIS